MNCVHSLIMLILSNIHESRKAAAPATRGYNVGDNAFTRAVVKMVVDNKASCSAERSKLRLASGMIQRTALILACLFTFAYVTLALLRIRYPFELEWIEGASLLQVWRILSGHQLYASPSIDYIPMIYSPLYFYTSAALAKSIGFGFLPLRLVSFVSSLGCLVLIYSFIRGEGYGRSAAIIACGLFSATYSLTTGWFDIARVDSMFLFLALGSLYALRFVKSPLHLITAATITTLAFQTKQSELAIIAPMIVYITLTHRWKALYFILPCAVCILISAIWMNRISEGWYNYYVFTLPSQGPVYLTKSFRLWFIDILPRLTIATALIAFYMLRKLDWQSRKQQAVFYLCATAGMIGAAWMGRIHWGGYVNVAMPVYAWISVLFGLVIGKYQQQDSEFHEVRSTIGPAAVFGLCIAQFVCLIYNPIALIPSHADYQAGMSLKQKISETKGDVFIPMHPYLALMAGKRPSMHRMISADITRSSDEAASRRIKSELHHAITHRRYNLIILDDTWIHSFVARYYHFKGFTFNDPSVFNPKTGLPKRPLFVYRK